MFTADASRQGYPLLDRRRSRPEAWFDAAHRARWTTCGSPAETPVTTTPALALERRGAVVGPLCCRWVTGDEAVGREPDGVDGVAAWPRWAGAEGPQDTRVWLTRPATAVPAASGRGRRPRTPRLVPAEPAPQRVDLLAGALPLTAWHPSLLTEGSQGPLVAEVACGRGVAVRAGLPGPEVWLVCRRAWGESPALTGSLSNAPAHTPGAALVRGTGRRWPIETALEESKGGLGMDHYEVRSWLGWHHHITLCLLAHHFLVRARQRVKKGRQH